MKILIGVGDSVRFNEIPDSLDFDTQGTVNWINVHSNTVSVDVPSWGEVLFSLNGSSWSDCGQFKRDITFVTWD